MKKKPYIYVCLLLGIMLVVLYPAMAGAVTKQGSEAWFGSAVANSLQDNDNSLVIQIPPKAFPRDLTVKVFKQDPAKVKAPEGYYVCKAADITFTNNSGNQEVNSMLPIRVIYSFDTLDYKRASQMDDSEPLSKFRIGCYNNAEKKWVDLPTTIFWDGQNGQAEATANLGSGHYALFWAPNASGASLSAMGGNNIRIFINYRPLYSKVEPFIQNGRALVPIGVISENLGAQVTWFSEDQRIEIMADYKLTKIWIGNTQGIKEGKNVALQVPPMIVGGRTFVPLGFVSQAVGADVSWDGISRSVYVVAK